MIRELGASLACLVLFKRVTLVALVLGGLPGESPAAAPDSGPALDEARVLESRLEVVAIETSLERPSSGEHHAHARFVAGQP